MTRQRNTKQRQAILGAFGRSARPLAPQEVLGLAAAEVPRLGLATVYRNIRVLEEEGVLARVELPGAPDRYELAGKGHHHHFHCRDCDRVFDVQGCPRAIAELTPAGFRLHSHEVILYGQCDDCADS
ncbi:MAG: transcriptional repressor [Holophagales bacterium]|nr:transcriptional repressor [Holophagales bacterium]